MSKRILAIQNPFLAKQINMTKYSDMLRGMCGEHIWGRIH